MELQDALSILGKLVKNVPVAEDLEAKNALQLVIVELDSMGHRLEAYERSDERHKKELERMVSHEQGATQAYERIIEGLVKLLQEG